MILVLLLRQLLITTMGRSDLIHLLNVGSNIFGLDVNTKLDIIKKYCRDKGKEEDTIRVFLLSLSHSHLIMIEGLYIIDYAFSTALTYFIQKHEISSV